MKKIICLLTTLLFSNLALSDASTVLYVCDSPDNVETSLTVTVEEDEHQVARLLINGEDNGEVTLTLNVDAVQYENDNYSLVVEGADSSLSFSTDGSSEKLNCRGLVNK